MSNLKLLTFASLLLLVSADPLDFTKHDKSFKEACDARGATYTPSTSPSEGDRCEVKEHGWQGETDESTRAFCKRNIPFSIVDYQKASSGGQFSCTAESMAVCKEGWVQLYGVCFKLVEELMKRNDVDERCKQEGGKIAFYHNRWLISRHFPYYFPDAYEMWIDASEAITNNVNFRQGKNLAIVNDLSGHVWKDVKVESFVMVDDDFEAFPLCQYTPPVTKARTNRLLEQYSEIYYPSIVTEEGDGYIRSTSSLQRNDMDKNAHNEYCRGVMKPFFRSLNAQSAVPTRELVDAITKGNATPGVVRFSVYSQDAIQKNRLSAECSKSGGMNFGIDLLAAKAGKTFFAVKDLKEVWRYKKNGNEAQPKEVCDGGSWSTGVALSRRKEDNGDVLGLETMSDARYGPIYCQTLFETMEYGQCPSGYTEYNRTRSGQRWCHKFFTDKKMKQEEAEAECAKDKAHLTGFEDAKELAALDKLAADSGATFHNSPIWLGAKRREICKEMYGGQGFNSDPNHPCSRRRCFEWVKGAAPNDEAFLDDYWMEQARRVGARVHGNGERDLEPNMRGDERCLELLKGATTFYNDKTEVDKKLNDALCEKDTGNYFICGREPEIVKTELVQQF